MANIKIHDLETEEIIEREMTNEELMQFEIDKNQSLLRIESEAVKAAEKAALLAQLGITEDQAKLLLS